MDPNTNSSALGYITYSSNFDSDPTGDMIDKVDDYCKEISNKYNRTIVAKMTGEWCA